MVQVAVDGLGVAAGGVAGGGAGADQVLQLAAWGVAVLGMPVVARAPCNGLEGGVQAAQELREPCRLGGAWTWRAWGTWGTWGIRGTWWIWWIWGTWGCPGVPAGCAGVGDRGAVGAGVYL